MFKFMPKEAAIPNDVLPALAENIPPNAQPFINLAMSLMKKGVVDQQGNLVSGNIFDPNRLDNMAENSVLQGQMAPWKPVLQGMNSNIYRDLMNKLSGSIAQQYFAKKPGDVANENPLSAPKLIAHGLLYAMNVPQALKNTEGVIARSGILPPQLRGLDPKTQPKEYAAAQNLFNNTQEMLKRYIPAQLDKSSGIDSHGFSLEQTTEWMAKHLTSQRMQRFLSRPDVFVKGQINPKTDKWIKDSISATNTYMGNIKSLLGVPSEKLSEATEKIFGDLSKYTPESLAQSTGRLMQEAATHNVSPTQLQTYVAQISKSSQESGREPFKDVYNALSGSLGTISRISQSQLSAQQKDEMTSWTLQNRMGLNKNTDPNNFGNMLTAARVAVSRMTPQSANHNAVVEQKMNGIYAQLKNTNAQSQQDVAEIIGKNLGGQFTTQAYQALMQTPEAQKLLGNPRDTDAYMTVMHNRANNQIENMLQKDFGFTPQDMDVYRKNGASGLQAALQTRSYDSNEMRLRDRDEITNRSNQIAKGFGLPDAQTLDTFRQIHPYQDADRRRVTSNMQKVHKLQPTLGSRHYGMRSMVERGLAGENIDLGAGFGFSTFKEAPKVTQAAVEGKPPGPPPPVVPDPKVQRLVQKSPSIVQIGRG